ncbi:atpH [Symbiodinium sp. CCMP2592]|nr:atpH [Symbiodinium sp. CCMP2592]
MGCSGSCASQKVCYVPKTFPAPPQDVQPPDATTHQLYVRQLDKYLVRVAKNPEAFQVQVERRREAFFGEVWTGSTKSQVRVHPVDSEAKWLSVGPLF